MQNALRVWMAAAAGAGLQAAARARAGADHTQV